MVKPVEDKSEDKAESKPAEDKPEDEAPQAEGPELDADGKPLPPKGWPTAT